MITGITVPGARVEAGQEVAISAAVTDASPSTGALTYQWSANVGSVTGTGSSVTWRLAPGVIDTGVNVVVSLTVVKPYQVLEGNQLVTREHRVTRQAEPFRAHDSQKEISRIAVTFLVDYFGNSAVSPDACMVDFSNGCPGTAEEYGQVVQNRLERLITSAQATIQTVELNAERTLAWVTAPCVFRDIQLSDGTEWVATGRCELTAVYEQARWWLCSSEFKNSRSEPASHLNGLRPSRGMRYWD